MEQLPEVHQYDLDQLSLQGCRNLFVVLAVPELPLNGTYAGQFTGPGWLRRIAGPLLRVGGLGGWCGKQFDGAGGGMNRVRRSGAIRHVVMMRIEARPSWVDGAPCAAVLYDDARMPLKWMHDELRVLDESRMLGLAFAHVPVLGRVGFPFLLERESD